MSSVPTGPESETACNSDREDSACEKENWSHIRTILVRQKEGEHRRQLDASVEQDDPLRWGVTGIAAFQPPANQRGQTLAMTRHEPELQLGRAPLGGKESGLRTLSKGQTHLGIFPVSSKFTGSEQLHGPRHWRGSCPIRKGAKLTIGSSKNHVPSTTKPCRQRIDCRW